MPCPHDGNCTDDQQQDENAQNHEANGVQARPIAEIKHQGSVRARKHVHTYKPIGEWLRKAIEREETTTT